MTISAYAAPSAKLQFTDSSGNFLAGGKLYTYSAGTTTKATTYQDAGEVTPNVNPIILDAEGRCTIFLPQGVFFKFTLAPATDTDPPTNPIWTVDNVGIPAIGPAFAVDTGSAGAIVVASPFIPAVAQGATVMVLTANASANGVTVNVNTTGAVALKDKAGNPMTTASYATNQMMILAMDGTFWRTLF